VVDARTQASSVWAVPTKFPRDRRHLSERGEDMPGQDEKMQSFQDSEGFAIGRRELEEGTSVISVEGELDLSTAPQLKWMLLDALEEGQTQLVLDLSLTAFMDSTALGVLVGVNRSLEAGRLAIVCPNAQVLKIFELSGIDAAFAISATLADALARAHAQTVSARTAEAG
jgi:anti-sigma B factor antagonist